MRPQKPPRVGVAGPGRAGAGVGARARPMKPEGWPMGFMGLALVPTPAPPRPGPATPTFGGLWGLEGCVKGLKACVL